MRRLSVCLLFALAWTLPAAMPLHAAPPAREQAAAREKLAELRSRMEALAREQAQTAEQRDSLNTTLARQARALAAAARALRETDAALAAKQQQLDDLQSRRDTLQATLKTQQAAVAELLRATYTLGRGSDLQLLLGDRDLAQIARALTYSEYFRQDRARRVAELMGQLARLQALEADIAAEQQALAQTRAERAHQAQALEQQRERQQKLAAQVDRKYRTQAERLSAMKRDAQSLDHLVARLQEAIDQANREAARSRQPSPAAPSADGRTNIRGDLPWPAGGAVVNYGNGVLIKAEGGSEVHAVASGRVVYAAFLRGYGLLLILNHGDGWMSMYGNNETLLHKVGDQVAAGQAVGTATAPTGLNTGVYFELRHHKSPVDPRRWLAARH